MTSRADRAAGLERWAENVAEDELVEVDRSPLREIAALAEQRMVMDAEVTDAVRRARLAGESWSEIGAILGVSKQAAQRKYGSGPPAA